MVINLPCAILLRIALNTQQKFIKDNYLLLLWH